MGRLGSDPEIKEVNDTQLAKFSLATDDSYMDKQGTKHEVTDWHNIEIWGGLAKVAQNYLKKGALVYIEGKSKTDQYQNEAGQTQYRHFIRGNVLKMLDKKKENGGY